jgi:C4-type Zn-finger protein
MSDKPVAYWSITLDAECPSCKADFDLIEDDGFRECGINPLERASGYEATCPHCEHEFLVDLEF